MIHCYALTTDGDLPATTGIDGVGILALACGRLHAVVSEHVGALRPTRERALTHAAVVARVSAHSAAVPVRFGVQCSDAEALRLTVSARADRLVDAVRRVGGHWELVVRSSGERAVATALGPALHAGADGRDYLHRRLEEERRRRAAVATLYGDLRRASTPLDALAEDVVERDGPSGPERCLLVSSSRVAEAVATARQVLAGRQDVLVGGPWPPYSFVEEVA